VFDGMFAEMSQSPADLAQLFDFVYTAPRLVLAPEVPPGQDASGDPDIEAVALDFSIWKNLRSLEVRRCAYIVCHGGLDSHGSFSGDVLCVLAHQRP
jgi:hypothetical protein